MPYINTITTKKITEDEKARLTHAFGKAIELLHGKSEKWLMLRFEGGASMAFRGNCELDCAMVEVELLGEGNKEELDALTGKICELLGEVLLLDTTRVYVK